MKSESPRAKRPVVLIVEDDPVLQEQMSAQLARMGFDVLRALHYDAALAHLAGAKPELALIDIELPTQSGFEICEYIRKQLGLLEVPILVTSESRHPEVMAYAEEAGADAFLGKPFGMSDLARYVEALVAKRKRSEPRIWRLRA